MLRAVRRASEQRVNRAGGICDILLGWHTAQSGLGVNAASVYCQNCLHFLSQTT